MKKLLALSLLLYWTLTLTVAAQSDPPVSFDLRDVDGTSYVTPVRSKACSS